MNIEVFNDSEIYELCGGCKYSYTRQCNLLYRNESYQNYEYAMFGFSLIL